MRGEERLLRADDTPRPQLHDAAGEWVSFSESPSNHWTCAVLARFQINVLAATGMFMPWLDLYMPNSFSGRCVVSSTFAFIAVLEAGPSV